jgi:hypothetical protein
MGVWCAVIVVGMTAPALGQERALDHAEPRLDRTQYEWLCQQVGLGRDQRMIAELLFSDYTNAVSEAVNDADTRAEAAGRKSVQDSVTGRARITVEELQRARIDVIRAYETVGPAVDNALKDLLSSTHSLLNPDQEPKFTLAIRELNRRIYLEPRRAGSVYEEYAGDGVDVIALAEEALKDGGELAPIGRESLADVLATYEAQLDAMLPSLAADDRAGRLKMKIAAVAKDGPELARQRSEAVARWRRLYELNAWAVQSIGQLAQQNLGEAGQQQWLNRFDRACFTWLFPRSRPERQFDWVMASDISAESKQKSREIMDDYLARRRELSRQAISTMIRARMEFQTMVYAMMDTASLDDALRQSLYADLLKNSGEQANLEASRIVAECVESAQARGLLGPASALEDVLRVDREARGLARSLLDPYVSRHSNCNP